jgi:uncharacterized protein (TIGR03086 family)
MSTEPLQASLRTSRAVLSNVTRDQMDLPTPCASWKVSDLVNHLVGAQYLFVSGVNGTPPSGESPDFSAGDYLAAFDEAAAASLAAFGAEGVLGKILDLPFGKMPGAAFMGLATTDSFTHAWDLAKATGQSTDLDPPLAASLLEASRQAIQPAFRGEEGKAPFGAERAAPAGATNADKLAAFLGREV